MFDERPRPEASPDSVPDAIARPSYTVLGLDPGSVRTGFALIRRRGTRGGASPRDYAVVDAGVLRADQRLDHRERIVLLHDTVYQLLLEHRPTVCVIERAFFGANANSALKLGELRGAYICAVARAGITLAELTPAEVKKTVVGNGRAEKEELSLALLALMGFDRGKLPHDVTDALAIGLSYALRAGGPAAPATSTSPARTARLAKARLR